MVCNNKEVSSEFLPFLKVYRDGTVERFLDSPYVPPSLHDQNLDSTINVSSKDIKINSDVSARIYLPPNIALSEKLPILLYFHGGAFLIESAFSFISNRYIASLVSQAKVIVISVEYRLAPENPLPIAYEDSWDALQWLSSHSMQNDENTPEVLKEPWLLSHADFDKVFVGGDSAGANIAHNLSLRVDGVAKIYGVLLSHPYFLGSKSFEFEPSFDQEGNLYNKAWAFAYPNAPNAFDNPMINPFSNDAPCLSGLQCSRLLICVAEKDELKERGVRYFNAVKKSGWKGKVEMFEVEGEDHCFQIFNLENENAKVMIKRIALFLNSGTSNQQYCTHFN